MIFGLTSFIGYGGSAPLGEEAVNNRAITKSLVFSLVIVGIVLTEVAYALTVGWGVSLMSTFAVANIPGIIVATAYTGVAGGAMFRKKPRTPGRTTPPTYTGIAAVLAIWYIT